MKFKWLSGDFAAEYNNTLSDLKKDQEALDKKYDIVMGEIVKREISRLENTVPVEYEVGTQVVNSHGNIGVIVGSHIELVVETHAKSDIDQDVVGPNKYWNISSASDEVVVTCEGMLRLYKVKFGANPLAQDWGVDSDIQTLYVDEFEVSEEE